MRSISGAAVAPGETIRLQRDAANTASFYSIDVIDVEAPLSPLARPAGSLSIADYGAVADDDTVDNSAAMQSCIDAAQTQKVGVWIPAGTFYVQTTGGLNATGIAIDGAGMWYSRVYRNLPLPNSVALGAIFNLDSCTVRNFALDSNALSRASVDGAGGGMDTTGTNWLADGIWTQHTESASASGRVNNPNCLLIVIWVDFGVTFQFNA